MSEVRLAVARGKIVNARGFAVAENKESALLETGEILRALKTQPEFEAFLEWEVE